MDNYKWLIVVLIFIGRNVDDAKADCVSSDPPCSNCTVDHQLGSEDSFPVGSYLTWKCNDGFTMEGDADAVVWVCRIDGKWLGDKPNCTVITCSSPPIPANGLVENKTLGNCYTPGDAIQYTCGAGYNLNNTETISTCLSNGTWTYMDPFCKIQCLDSQKSFPEQNSCFDVPADKMKWDEARDYCKNEGGFLALVKNDETQHFLRDNFEIGEGLWIGGKAGRHWKWSSDGRNITRLFWDEDEPNNDDEGCIEIRHTSSQNDWNDEDCESLRGFICQFDSSACSGKYLNTHIHRVLYRGDCYQFFDDSSKWDVGRTYCEDIGGYLAEILDRSAQDFISDEVKIVFGDGKQWWIGGHEDSPEEPRSWFWVDNTRILIDQWADGEPNDYLGNENCIELSNSINLKWNDEKCNKDRRHVCQFGLPSCGDPGEPLHGSRTPSDTSTFLDGATIEYQCYLGYEVKGSTSATCMLNGRWDTERPVCKAVMCPNNTSEVDNVANVTVTSEEYRGVAVYTCSPGYLPDASPVSYCQADGTWSNPNFTCMSLPPCYVEPCYNGATCSNHNGTFTCECAGGFTGLRCDTAMTTPPTEPETNPLSTSSKPDTVSFTSPSTSAGETSTQPSGGEPQPKPNVAAIAGGISATLIVIILPILAVALVRKRKRPSSKNGQEMILGNERDLKSEANNYSIVDNRKPVTAAGTDNRAFAGDTTGNVHVNVIVQSEPEPRNAPSEDETQFVGADMVENALYGANDSASGQGSRDGTPNVQLLGVAARYVVTDDSPNVQLEGALSKSIPTYGRVDKSQSQMVENELYGETDESERHQMYEKTGIDLKDSPNLQTEMNSAPNDGMVDNELYALSPDDATYQEVEENDQEVIFEEDNDSMVDNALYSASDVTGHVGREGGTVYQNEEYHDVPDYLADNELYNMK